MNVMSRKTIFRISALISGISGVIILVGVIYPIVSYNSTYSKNFQMISPISGNKSLVQGVSTSTSTNLTANNLDYTQASSWFPGAAKKEDFTASKVTFYTIDVPKLKIKGATVAIGGEDLSQHLIQYPGTALPGKRGNSVIFGHSILPIFYNPKNYISIFSMLPTIPSRSYTIRNSFPQTTLSSRSTTTLPAALRFQMFDAQFHDPFLNCVP